MRLTHPFTAALLALALIAGTGATSRPDREDDGIDPRDFTLQINNPYFPLVPGTTYIYEGTNEEGVARSVFEVTRRTKTIMGVKCREILDRAYVNGILAEETLDWFAQDDDGNVWYFGEDTKELDANGHVISTDGTWLAGVDDALPGIIMEARPRVGDTYQQEFAPDVAEDMATVVSKKEKVTVPFGAFKNCLKTEDFTPLSPGNVEHKYYARGIGFIKSIKIRGGNEQIGLVKIIKN